MTTKKKSAAKEPKITVTKVDGRNISSHHRNKAGVIVKTPKGKYVNQFGAMLDIPKKKTTKKKKD